ncbi:MAG: outer membrane beta-barrel protein [Bacteroidia bacterium]
MQKITLLFLLCFSIFGHGQSVTLKGTIQDPDGIPLEAATVYFRWAKDSTVAHYTITDAKGNWQIKNNGYSAPVNMLVSYIGFTNYKKQLDKVAVNTDFGIIKMEAKGTELSEVVIESEVPPIRVKKDTLEFDAASFKVRPDANVETLLKQLPGVQVDASGKVTVNGKEVTQILVNGKPFFDRDGKIVMQNLPAELIKKIQVSDYKTTQEEISGKNASGETSSINLTIDKEKNKGMFGRVTAGMGTDDRYELNGQLNYFKDKQKVSVLASSNNINASGFSNDLIFDSMGGGRNVMIGGIGGGSGGGIARTDNLGVNYTQEVFKDFEPTVSYNYNNSNRDNYNRSRTETLLAGEGDNPGSRQLTDSYSKSKSLDFSHAFNAEARYKIDTTAVIDIRPKFTRGNTKNTNYNTQSTVDDAGNVLNESNGNTMRDADNSNFSTSFNLNKRIGSKKGRRLGVSGNVGNVNNNSAYYNVTNTTFYRDTDDDGVDELINDNRNQLQQARSVTTSYSADVSYNEPISKKVDLEMGTEYSNNSNDNDTKGYTYDEGTAGYTRLDDNITSYQNGVTRRLTPYAEFTLKGEKLTASIRGGTNYYGLENSGNFRGQIYVIDKSYLISLLSGRVTYRPSKGKNFRFTYNFNPTLPSMSQLLPITDFSNALSTVSGNPNLDPGKSHRITAGFNSFNFSDNTNISVFGFGNIVQTQIVNYVEISDSGKRTVSYRNMRGGYSAMLSGNYYKQVKTDAGNRYTYGASLGGNYSYSLGYNNGNIYTAKQLSLTPGLTGGYDLGELLNIRATYGYSLNNAKYTNYSRGAQDNFRHNASLNVTNYWPKHVVMGNDISYSYNSQLTGGYRKDMMLWNISAGYMFWKDQLMFKVKVYDMLNRNNGTSRSITDTGFVDSETLVLKRYAMFSLSWRISKFGTKLPSFEKNNILPGSGGGRGARRRG